MTSSEELKFSRWGVWVAQSVERLTSAQVLISPFVSLSLASVSVLTAQSLEPASRSVSPFLSAPSPLTLSVSLSKINSKKKKKKNHKFTVGRGSSGGENCSASNLSKGTAGCLWPMAKQESSSLQKVNL